MKPEFLGIKITTRDGDVMARTYPLLHVTRSNLGIEHDIESACELLSHSGFTDVKVCIHLLDEYFSTIDAMQYE